MVLISSWSGRLVNIETCAVAGNETFERLATFGLSANFMVYLMRELHMDQVSASNVFNIWFGITNFAPLLGAIISDAYAGRFRTIAVASFASFLVCFLSPYCFIITIYCNKNTNK